LLTLPDDRYLRLAGTPYQVGYQLGEKLQTNLAEDITHYLTGGPLKFGEATPKSLAEGAPGWFESLPPRFRLEMEGLAEGSGVPIQRIAEWAYADAGGKLGCSAFLLRTGDALWVGRNNDLWAPEFWGYAIRRQVTGRLGTLSFGLQGELFAVTGVNQAGLWLHYNGLPATDRTDAPGWTPYVLLTEILETCKNVDEVEAQLRAEHRTGGMLVFVAGPKGQAAILECSCSQVTRQDLNAGFLVGANHYQFLPDLTEKQAPPSGSRQRAAALAARLTGLPSEPDKEDLIAALADPQVEQRGADYGTVYAALYNPLSRQLWFTFGGYPAASQGDWQAIPWPY